ncbi:peptidase S8/S53 domain-containing protein [Cladorrhinum sp. PSN332]|nr:peptidase S8/S53 domain-containing protein [Cladorrhinum sp. PSN332]
MASDNQQIALKLTPEGQQKQLEDPNFIINLVNSIQDGAETQGLGGASAPLASEVAPLISLELQQALAASAPAQTETPEEGNTEDLSFDTWYQVTVPGLANPSTPSTAGPDAASSNDEATLPPSTLSLIRLLLAHPDVESAHSLTPCAPPSGPADASNGKPVPPAVNPGNDPRSPNQQYLNAAPVGIDARYAWTKVGGDGATVRIVDLEQGWNLNHEDLRAGNITLISGVNKDYFYHGTAVLGEMLMVDNTIGGVGIVPQARGRVVSQWRTSTRYNTAEAILSAVSVMTSGSILLLEAQAWDPAGAPGYWPVEVEDSVYTALRTAYSRGIAVVEAAGNGSNNLDTYRNAANRRIFNRSYPNEFRDSGAIMIGAASSTVPHVRLGFSNYGNRIDCYGWGQNINTTYTNAAGTSNEYTTSFSGTSGASPIVVGAAAAVQGIAQARLNRKLPPARLRTVVKTAGTPSGNPANDKIGVMPNLRRIIDGGHIHL